MANRAYLSIWSQGFNSATLLEQFGRLLETVPFSSERPGLTGLVIRAVDQTETSLVDHDLRSHPLDAAGVVELAQEYPDADTAYEVQTDWELWVYDTQESLWLHGPQRLEIICHGEEYDTAAYLEAGHFQADLGFEHLFTGHGGLLGPGAAAVAAPQHPIEAAFLATMSRPENLREYHQKTRENIRKLTDWLRAIEDALPVARSRLWSEGEENFEARLDEILAVR